MPDERFQTTRWSRILRAGERWTPEARDALSALSADYFYPCYAFVRGKVRDADKAWDLTQGFFADLLEKNRLATVVPGRGLFRSWLRTSLSNYLANEWDREQRAPLIPVDSAEMERRFSEEPSADLAPEQLMERSWAFTVLERALGALQAEEGGDLPRALMQKLRGDAGKRSYEQIAEELGRSPDAVKMAAHRLRRRWRELVREVIADTLESDGESETDSEIQHLMNL